MRFTKVHLSDVRCFTSTEIELDALNVLVGANNAGKSTILRCLAMVQEVQLAGRSTFVRVGTQRGNVSIAVADVTDKDIPQTSAAGWDSLTLQLAFQANGISLALSGRLDGQPLNMPANRFVARFPDNPILPFLAARRQFSYSENVTEQSARQITGNLSNLAQRLQYLQSRHRWQRYVAVCNDILGFHLTAITTTNGLLPGIVVGDDYEILVDGLGDGVPMVAWLVSELIGADRKVILVEEPEHDLHPSSLKKLLDLMVESSTRNQVLVTTHSHVVLNTLGAHGRVYRVDAEPRTEGEIPRSSVTLTDSYEERMRVLDDLGYALGDMGLYDGWLILEEASAEAVVRQLAEWFAPRLAPRLRTVAGNGAERASKMFDDYNRLFLFLHLEPRYRERAWVIVDGDEAGTRTVKQLQTAYSTWDAAHFRTWSKSQFEDFYPQRFQASVSQLTGLPAERRRDAKTSLAKQVSDWMLQDPQAARAELEKSAPEVIELLRTIDRQLLGQP